MRYCPMSLIYFPAANYTDLMHKAAIECLCVLVLNKKMRELDDLEAAEIEGFTRKELSKLLCIRGLPPAGKVDEMRHYPLKKPVDRSVLRTCVAKAISGMVIVKERDGDDIVPVGMSKSAVLLQSLSLKTADILAKVRGEPADIREYIEATPTNRKITSFFDVQAAAAPPTEESQSLHGSSMGLKAAS